MTIEDPNDLIEFLRNEGLDPCDHAADLIESLRAELERYRKELRHIVTIGQLYQLSPSDVEDAEELLSTHPEGNSDE